MQPTSQNNSGLGKFPLSKLNCLNRSASWINVTSAIRWVHNWGGVTLEPVTTRIDLPVTRVFVADWVDPDEAEYEIPQGDETEPLGPEIDMGQVMIEALALALPQYPRKDGVQFSASGYTEPGKQVLTDDDVKPFAGLAQLRDTLEKDK